MTKKTETDNKLTQDELKLIDKIVSNWKYPLKDLNKLPALLPLKRLLSNLISDTGKSYAKLFSNYLIDE